MTNYNVNIVSNLDRYNSRHFPELPVIPRVDEYIAVLPEYSAHFTKDGYPAMLQVKSVTYYETFVEISVWYSETQLQLLKLNNREI